MGKGQVEMPKIQRVVGGLYRGRYPEGLAGAGQGSAGKRGALKPSGRTGFLKRYRR